MSLSACAFLFFGKWDDAPNPRSHSLDAVSAGDPILIQVTGSEFQWVFHHSGSDGVLQTQDDVEMGNELVVPPNRMVNLQVVSADFLYSLSQPELGINEIAVPGVHREVSFQSPESGSFSLLSDPLCGFRWTHDEVMGRVVVQSGAIISD